MTGRVMAHRTAKTAVAARVSSARPARSPPMASGQLGRRSRAARVSGTGSGSADGRDDAATPGNAVRGNGSGGRGPAETEAAGRSSTALSGIGSTAVAAETAGRGGTSDPTATVEASSGGTPTRVAERVEASPLGI